MESLFCLLIMMNKFGLVGKTLEHSFSKKYFTKKFENEGLSCEYLNYEFNTVDEVESLRKDPHLKGFNVTIPYKESIVGLLDTLSPIALEIGAVNTVEIVNGKWIGHNTDVFGFRQMIKPFFKSHHERAMIIGTGGASKAVAYVLEQIGADVIFISRNPSNEFEFDYSDINEEMMNACKIIVNTSPVGTYPNVNDEVNLPYTLLTPKHLVVDLIYNPSKTRMLQLSEDQGAWVLNGRTMLEQQAEQSWKIWNSNV